ncbi:MAG: helix-turn-helix domain-containing protein, partial [Acidimicrobiales bacterium]
MSQQQKPVGKREVMAALIDATVELIVEEGLEISVRRIAARAAVNHGLIHLYFGSKQCLLSTAIDEINTRAGQDLDADGFP